MNSDFLDSYVPIDGEVVTDDPWPMPAPRDYSQLEAEPPTLWERFFRRVKGVQHD